MPRDDREGGSHGDSQSGEGSAADDPFAVELNEDFIKSASATEESGDARARKARKVAAAAKQAQTRQAAERARAQAEHAKAQAKQAKAQKRRQRGGRFPAARAMLFVLIGGGLVAALVFWRPGSAGPNAAPSSATATPVPLGPIPASPDVTARCFAGDAGCGSMDMPFADSPAETYADGADGIVLPPAAATAHFSASTVAEDLATTKRFLVDQYLEPDVLFHGAEPTDVLALLDPESVGLPAIEDSFSHPSVQNDPSFYALRFDPAHAAQVGSVIKVHDDVR